MGARSTSTPTWVALLGAAALLGASPGAGLAADVVKFGI